ncbi:serine-rich coiled-coil domain-containing protein 2 [Chanos chanos]|uniref:Serine-rich coiled-coil domain-containing protein 2 n=1 Tax=Chanos chanos TaxID=29144 RepID=A0A6J2WD02_CHACN|nr:serine-rich coiled-coil domain-containing protein 2-like [Chanos chanos]
MEEKVSVKPNMVSRLPKFGVRASGGLPAPNSSTQTGPIHEAKATSSVKPNGIVRTSSFKWRKESGSPTTPPSPEESSALGEKGESRHLSSTGTRELKKPSTPTTKVRRSASSVSSGSPKVAPKLTKSIASPKTVPKFSQSPASQNQDPAQALSTFKPSQNGVGLMGASGRSGSGLLRPRANSGSQRSSSRDSLSQSSDSLKSVAQENMVRSQSFTHFKQLPSPTTARMTRSFSFNKAVELAKPLADTQLRPPRTTGLKPPQSFNGDRLGLGSGALGKGLTDQATQVTPSSACPTPLSGLKKALLPSCVLNKSSSLGYRLTRTSAAKPQRPLLAGKTHEEESGDRAETDIITPPLTPEPIPCCTEVNKKKSSASASDSESHSGMPEPYVSVHHPGEGQEDMSLSSASSLERNDTSEEFLDDFDNLGDQSHDILPHNVQHKVTPTQTRLRSFLNETMDWASIGLLDGKAPFGGRGHCNASVLSPEVDFPPGSSLELSPSNSSGGTYMWDEEGLEPMGPDSQHCDSYDSDINSMDILNNLGNLGSGDLEDDDLMLDVDLPEDGSLHSDGMAHFDLSERGGRQGHWRRRQHRWSGPDNFHNDSRSAVSHGYESHRGGSRPLRADSHTVVLDELTLRHMAQDCSSVKSQLLKLKSLLQLDDSGVIQDTEDSSEDNSTSSQLEDLMREVADLREELRNKDKIIANLKHKQVQQQQQSPVRCQCQQRSPAVRGERRAQHDKATQTPWRGHAVSTSLLLECHPVLELCCPFLSSLTGSVSTRGLPVPACPNANRPQILQPYIHTHNELHTQGKLAKLVPTGVHSELSVVPMACKAPYPPSVEASVTSQSSQPLPDPEELSILLSTHLRIYDNHENLGHAQEVSVKEKPAPKLLSRPGDETERASPEIPHASPKAPHSLTQFTPRVLQAPRLHKRVFLPALPLGEASGAWVEGKSMLKPGSTANHKPRQLPPPSRGLPCFSAGSPPVILAPTRSLLPRSRPLVGSRELNVGEKVRN